MCDKAIDAYPSLIKIIPRCFMTQEMRHKAIYRCFFVSDLIPDKYKTQKNCDRAFPHGSFLMVYCPDKYITQKL